MSEQTRAILKEFGIRTTQFEDAVAALERNPSVENLRNYLESQRSLFESLSNLLNLLADLLSRGASAAEKTSRRNSEG